MKFSQVERGINNFSAASGGYQKFNRVFHPISTTTPRELKNDNSLSLKINRSGTTFGITQLNFGTVVNS